jgi:hypothetical protein
MSTQSYSNFGFKQARAATAYWIAAYLPSTLGRELGGSLGAGQADVAARKNTAGLH